MSANHTPGPWTKGESDVSIYAEDHQRAIARTFDFPGLSDGEAEANARLIALLPDLLTDIDALKARERELVEALEGLLSEQYAKGTVGVRDGYRIEARAVLAKVRP